MAELTIQKAFDLALGHHKAGRLPEAERVYRQILAHQPEHYDALHLLGVIAHQVGRDDAAVELIGRAILINPNLSIAHNNLGSVFQKRGQLDEAIAAHRRAIELEPGLADAHNNLGNVLARIGELEEAIAAYRQAIALQPGQADGYCNLGVALEKSGRLDEAIDAQRQALLLDPQMAEAQNNLGIALAGKGQFEESVAAYRRAIALRPNNPRVFANLGNALRAKGELEPGIDACRRAIALDPDYADAYANLGNALGDKGELDDAVAAYRKAIALNDNLAENHHNLGTVLWAMGLVREAIAEYRRAIEIKPGFVKAHSNLVYSMHFHPDYDAKAIAEEHSRWNKQHAEAVRRFIRPLAPITVGGRLKVGYVSADFREHPVGRFLEPLLEQHDRQGFEIFCYSDVSKPDEMTGRLRSRAEHWREISGQADESVAERIRADAIDILVDLSGHTAGNRLLVFARKPARVQVSYLGYPGATGMDTIDYVLTDHRADPAYVGKQFHAQALYRLPQTNWCFAEREGCPPVGDMPAKGRGCVAFGSLNNFAKVTDEMLDVWGRILREIPCSRLMIKSAAAGAASVRERISRHFAAAGVEISRVTLLGTQADYASYLALYGDVDIALDTFPYHGTTTTCEALWMGVPVITLAGESHVSRVGVSLLGGIGMSELVANNAEEYVRLAVELARDQERMAMLRGSLRQRMRRSPLMDAASFARDIEAAYRTMLEERLGRRSGET